jgi:hypothetical protein
MTEIENLIYQFEGEQRKIMLHFHNLLTNEYDLTSRITFKCPCYYRKSWICYLKPTKRNSIELTFFRGNELSNNQGLLTNNGRKQLLSIDIDKVDSIPESALNEIFHEALLLDKTTPYESKRKNKKQQVN